MKRISFICTAVLISCVLQGTFASESSVKSVTVITEVFGEGQKVTAAVLEYDRELETSKLTTGSFAVENRTITSVYANTIAETRPALAAFAGGPPGSAAPQQGVNGRFVIIELSVNDPAASLFIPQGFTFERLKGEVSVRQTKDLTAVDATSVSASPVVYASTKIVNLVVDDFVQKTFTDSVTGVTVKYNLYIPENYDPEQKYPLVMFIHDAGVTSAETTTTLVQGNGATVWASPAEQAKHPSFVLAPQYSSAIVNDSSKASPDLEATARLISSLQKEYSIDAKRIYATGQSGGCMSSIYMNIRYPNLFAASYLVAGQWDPSVVAPLAKDSLWIVVSQGDQKAFPGMNAITAVLESLGTDIGRGIWNGRSTADEFDFLVAQMLSGGNSVNYVALEKGTVVTPGLEDNPATNHICTWRIAYNIEGIRDWLFTQHK